MAKIGMNVAFDMRAFDLNDLSSYQHFQYLDNVSYTFNSPLGTYSASDAAFYYDGPDVSHTTASFVVAGTGISYNATAGFTSGRLTGLIKLETGLSSASEGFYALNFDIAATAFSAAAKTASVTDDRTVLRLMLAGADSIAGSQKTDYLFAGNGNDTVIGNAGNDTLFGEAGNDSIDGGFGNDRLLGGLGNDIVKGGAGADVLIGGAGFDKLAGGVDTAHDLFVFSAANETGLGVNADRIFDFVHLVDDINLSAIDGDTGTANLQHLLFHGTTAAAHSVWLIDTGNDFVIRGDVNGNTTADFEIRLVNCAGSVDASDLWL